MWRNARCRRPHGQVTLKGLFGAFVLGLAYGILSGSCTFGFIVSVQATMFTGLMFILLFAIGHCIPIVIAGSSTAMVKRLLISSSWQQGGRLFRRLAGILIALLGVYFVVQPFFQY